MHSPVDEAKRLIGSGQFRILSLDIFDTAVWRAFPVPADLFFALGQDLISQGILYPSSSAASFCAERVEAEQTARGLRQSDSEVTLDEIYACFPPGLLRRGTTRDVLKAELHLEARCTYADAEISALIDEAVSRGLEIAYVSDTYFDETHLRRILERPARWILNSCRFRKPKVRGLHAELMRQSGIKPNRILHLGDNFDADFRGPAELGIKTVWRPRFPGAFSPAIQGEISAHRSQRALYFLNAQGDAGLTSLRAQTAGTPSNWNDPFRSWGALFLGPLMAGFGRWVKERCAGENIGTALCLMREGRILKKVLDGLGPGLRTVEFYTSRYALIRASIFEGREAELQRYLARPRPVRARDIFEPLGIQAAEIGLADDALISAESAGVVAKAIAGHPGLRARAVEASAQARQRFLQYLRRTVPKIDERVAVVDLGYSGTIQNCLQEILDHEGIASKTHGLYFVTGSGVRKIQRTGACAEGYLAENGQPLAIAHSFMRSPELVEQCLMCDSGSTIAYTEAGEPVLGNQILPAKQLSEIERVQEGLLSFVARFAAAPEGLGADSNRLKPFLEAIVVRALTQPTPAELEAFGSWVHDENFGSEQTRPLISAALDEDYLRHASAHQLASLQSADAYWIFGLAQKSSPVVGEAVRSIFLRKAPPEVFNSPDAERPIFFFWNDGAAHRAEQRYSLSSRRTAWTRFSLEFRNANLMEVGFSAGNPGDFIQVGGMVLRLSQPGAPESVVRLSVPALQTFGVERLGNHSFLVTDTPGFVAAVEEVREFTGVVHVDILFTQVPAESKPETRTAPVAQAVEKEMACPC